MAGIALAGVPYSPHLSTPLPSPPCCSTGHSWHIARPPRYRLSCPPGTAGAGPQGAAPCLPSPLRGACGDEMGTRAIPSQRGSFGDAGSSAVLSCQPCAVPQSWCAQAGLSLTRRVGNAGGHRWRGLASSWHRSCGSSRAGRGADRARGRAGTPVGGSWPSPAPSSSPVGRKCHLPSVGLKAEPWAQRPCVAPVCESTVAAAERTNPSPGPASC